MTIGAPIDSSPNAGATCQSFLIFGIAPSCSLLGVDPAARWTMQTPSGNWVIKRARVRAGASVGPMVFTVIRVLRSQAKSGSGAICCTVPVESGVFTPAPNAVTEVPTHMPVVNTVESIDGEPVEVIDYLGISLLDPSATLPLHQATTGADPAAGAGLSYFIPAMRQGQQALQSGGVSNVMPLIAADLDPAPTTAVPPGATNGPGGFNLLPRTRLLRNGTRARLGAQVPGPGLLRALQPRVRTRAAARSTATTSRHRRKQRKMRSPQLIASAKRRVKRAGKAYVTIRLTGLGKRLLRKRGKLKVPVKFVFKPEGGAAVGKTRAVTFRKPHHRRR